MGGLGAAVSSVAGAATTKAAIGTGLSTMNLINSTKTAKRNAQNLQAGYQSTLRNRKNLLDQQMAARRASLGAMGITSSPSAAAIQKRQTQQIYEDINEDAENYKRKVAQNNQNVQSDYYNNLLNGVLPNFTKLIK